MRSILKGVIGNGKSRGLRLDEERFVQTVLRDAETLDWGEGQLRKRRRAVRSVIIGRTSSDWRRDADSYGPQDKLFERHGWNQVDSGFRLWGGSDSRQSQGTTGMDGDDFLESKGWNNVDSGFRIL